MSIEFNITGKKIIYFQEVDTISILLSNNQKIELLKVAFIPECESNVIFFGQLQNTRFIYYDKSTRMTLIRSEKFNTHARCNQNLIVFDLIKLRKAMAVSCGGSIYIVSKNKQIRIWHRRPRYTSNTRVVGILKLVDRIIINNNTKYNSEKMFINFNLSKSDEQPIVPSKDFVFIASIFSASLVNTLLDFDQLCDLYIRS